MQDRHKYGENVPECISLCINLWEISVNPGRGDSVQHRGTSAADVSPEISPVIRGAHHLSGDSTQKSQTLWSGIIL